MTELWQTAIAGANLGPTVLLGLLMLYWLFVILGAVGLDLFDFHADADVDVGGDLDVDGNLEPGAIPSALSIGALVLKSLNIGLVPLMVWLSAFALSLWVITMLWDHPATHESVGRELVVLFRNGVLAILAAKLLTQPLRGQFNDVVAPRARDLVGRVCSVATLEVTDRSGQIRCETGAAPLLLNARIQQDSEPLKKGDTAVIVEYQQGIYFVRKAQQEDLQ